MRRKLFGFLLAVSAVALFVPAFADDRDMDEGDAPTIKVHGEVRARWEYLDNFSDFNSDDTSDDSFDFTPYRARVGVDADFGSKVAGHIEIQNHGAFGNQIPGTDDPLLQNFQVGFGNETVLYQANMDIKEVFSPNFSLRIGRQEHMFGNELQMGDADFYSGLTFDGIRGMYDAEKWDLDVFWYKITELGFLASGGSDDRDFGGATLNFGIGDGDQKIEPYLLLMHDGQAGGVIVNPAPVGPPTITLPTSAANFWTLGALYHRPPSQDHSMDWSVEFALQTGNTGPSAAETDVGGSILEGWFGYSFGDTSRHRVHIGALMVSGDDDLTDTDNDAFIPLFPDTHAYNRLGDLDFFGSGFSGTSFGAFAGGCSGAGFSNMNDINAGYDWTSGAHHFAGSLHAFAAAEDSVTIAPGTTINCDGNIGSEIDLSYDYAVTHNLSFQAGVANFMPGDDFQPPSPAPSVPDDSAMRGWIQARLRF